MEGRDPRRRIGWISLAALLAGLVRLPFLARPLSSDEGGYLMVAAQWHPGSSLYGSYWVDRPPLLIALFRLADVAGGTVALRLLGVVVAVGSVLLAAWIGRIASPGPDAPPDAPVYAAVTAAVFVSTPLFDAQEVNGELLALPFLLAGTGCVLAAVNGAARHPARWWLAAGALAAAAALVKQNMLEVVVVAGTALAYRVGRPAAGRSRRTALSGSVRAGALFVLGGAVVTAVALTVADLLGTHPLALWNALVEFRIHASREIARNAGDHMRLLWMLGVFTLSGAPVLVVALVAVAVRRRREGLRGPAGQVPVALLAGAALAWEAVAIAGGGSYWWHYQMASITGLVLASAALAGAGVVTRRRVRIVLGYAAAVTVLATVLVPTWAVGPKADPPVVHFLRTHARPGDTGAVAFGDPAILRASGLSSPYPQLWSLPVKVRDPHLRHFARVLGGPTRPTWIVSFHARLGTWGKNTSTAETALRQHYTKVTSLSGFVIYEADTALARRGGASSAP